MTAAGCRIFDHTVNLKIVLFTGKKKTVSSYGVAQPLAHIFNPSGWNTDIPVEHSLNPKQ